MCVVPLNASLLDRIAAKSFFEVYFVYEVGIFCTVAGIWVVLALGRAWGRFVWRGSEPVRGLPARAL